MGFSGGGSNVLKPHKHSSAVQDGSPLNMNNVTEAALNAGDIVYSDGAALQRLAIGASGTILVASGASPSWSATASNPLIKVTKTFADIAALEMDIYTLPQDAALVNVYTDITTVFDVSTGVTIGDGGDDNGFQEATDWTAGTGLTDATRGAYVTTFKTMRSTSGTTAIKAYNFSGTATPPLFDAQAQTSTAVVGDTVTNSGFTVASNSNRVLVMVSSLESSAQQISGVTWNGVETFTSSVTIDSSGKRSEIWYLVNPTATTADVVTTWASNADERGAGVYSFYNVNQASPIGVTNTATGTGTTTTGTITPTTAGSAIVDVQVSDTVASPPTDTLTAGWSVGMGGSGKSFGSQYDLTPTINASNNMFWTYPGSIAWAWCAIELKTASAVTSDSQGAVDFYLQVVD